MNKIDFSIKWKDYEWKEYTTTEVDEPLYELVRWEEYNGKKSCYVIVFIRWNRKEWCWEINDSMTRWLDLPEEDLLEVTKITKHVLKLLNTITPEE